ncbi:hypothetical protein Tco_1011538 [Tanacetum coccineum]
MINVDILKEWDRIHSNGGLHYGNREFVDMVYTAEISYLPLGGWDADDNHFYCVKNSGVADKVTTKNVADEVTENSVADIGL